MVNASTTFMAPPLCRGFGHLSLAACRIHGEIYKVMSRERQNKSPFSLLSNGKMAICNFGVVKKIIIFSSAERKKMTMDLL